MRERDDWHLTNQIKHEEGSGDPFAAAVRATRMPMVITDPSLPDNPIVFCNEAFQKLTGYARDEIVGRNCRFLQGPDTDRAAVRAIHDAIQAGHDIDIDLLNYRKNGTTFWNALYLSPVRNKAGEIRYFFASQLDVTERIRQRSLIAEQKAEVEREVERRTADLQAALEAKTLLLHEVDHRVKNNLTMIGSLLRLQVRTIGDPEATAKLEAMLERVDALSTVHRRLYQSDDVTTFEVGGFTENLLSDLLGANGRTDIKTDSHFDQVDISSSRAAALGLLLSEVLTNAIKHGFADGRGGTLTLTGRRDGDQAAIVISDDGPGLGTNNTASSGLGAMLIKRLARQVGAEVRWRDAEPGTGVTISFPLEMP